MARVMQSITRWHPIDTKTLIDLFIEKNKSNYYTKISQLKYSIWAAYFKTDHNVSKRKKYIFDCGIVTDGYGISIQFVMKDNIEYINKSRQSRAQGSKDSRKVYKNISNNEKKIMMDKKYQEKARKQKGSAKKYSERRKAEKEEFDKLNEEEQDKRK